MIILKFVSQGLLTSTLDTCKNVFPKQNKTNWIICFPSLLFNLETTLKNPYLLILSLRLFASNL